MTEKPSETPYLHVREIEGSLLRFAVEVTGNAKALLRLRKQIDRALKAEEYPLEEGIYRELDGEGYEVVVKRAKSREEMEPPRPKKTEAEREGWAERERKEQMGEPREPERPDRSMFT